MREAWGTLLFIVFVCAALAVGTTAAGAEDSVATEAPEESGTSDTEAGTDGASEVSEEELARNELLREGSAVYTQICASCHQAGGIGLEGQYPPLIDNPRVDDAAYIEEVIVNGRQGELEVNGVVYNSVMPSFSTLSDDDTEAVIAFIQNDFVAPPAENVVAPIGPVAGTELPALANMGYVLTMLIAAGLFLLVLAPRLTSENDRLNFPWLDAWLRTAVIVSAVILLTVYIPDWALKTEPVGDLSRFAQDLIAVSLWLAGLVAVLWGLWYAHRRARI